MSKIPVQVWALLLAFLGAILATIVLFVKAEATIAQAVLQIAATLVSGAIGAFAGHAIGSAKTDVTATPASVTISQADPK